MPKRQQSIYLQPPIRKTKSIIKSIPTILSTFSLQTPVSLSNRAPAVPPQTTQISNNNKKRCSKRLHSNDNNINNKNGQFIRVVKSETVPTAVQTILGVLRFRGGWKRAKLLPRLQSTSSGRAGNRAEKVVVKLFIAAGRRTGDWIRSQESREWGYGITSKLRRELGLILPGQPQMKNRQFQISVWYFIRYTFKIIKSKLKNLFKINKLFVYIFFLKIILHFYSKTDKINSK